MDNESISKEELEKIKAEIKKEILSVLSRKLNNAIRGLNRENALDRLMFHKRYEFALTCAKMILYPKDKEFINWKQYNYSIIDWKYIINLPPGEKFSSELILNNFFDYCDHKKIFKILLDFAADLNDNKETREIDFDRKFRDYRCFCHELSDILSKNEILDYGIYTELVNKYIIS